ncbi:hypothetical protein GOV10_00430, partial [Candidatus Woesearchaeota archaeon]|nr:hypothetical protein [Candidatus Woesearchaeota archaeon]
RLSNGLRLFENISKKNKELENISDDHQHDVVLAGYDRTGYSIFKTLQRMKKDFVVVEYDPEIIKKLIDENIPCVYGDIGDVEILEKLRLKNVKLVISTIPHQSDTILLIKKVKEKNPHAHLIVTSDSASSALELYDLGADYVIVPHYLGGDHVALILEEVTDDLDKLIDTKIAHIKDLHARRRHHKNKKRN